MAVFTFDFLDLFSMMAVCTILLEGLSVIFTRRVAVRTLQSIPGHMCLMREFYIVEGNRPFLHPYMAKGCAGHLSLKLLGLISFINFCYGLLCLIAGGIEKFEGIFDIVNALAQKDKAVIMAGFVEEVLTLFKLQRPPSVFFKIIQHPLNIEDALIGLILCFGKEGFPMLQRIIVSLTMTIYTGLPNCPLDIFGGMERSLTLLSLSMAGNTVHIRRKHQARGIR
jgi:hypothetical protein